MFRNVSDDVNYFINFVTWFLWNLRKGKIIFMKYSKLPKFLDTKKNAAINLKVNSIPILPLQRVFYPKNWSCTPKIEGLLYMLLYVGEKRLMYTLNFKIQWEPSFKQNNYSYRREMS